MKKTNKKRARINIKPRPKIVVKHPTYQPSKAEMEEEFPPIHLSPEELGKCLRGDLVYENENK